MERLTERFASGDTLVSGCGDNCKHDFKYCDCLEDCPTIDEIVERLADYEDTGLTPEQIVEIDKLYAEQARELAELKEIRTPKKPTYEGDGYDDEGNIVYDTWYCPNCNKDYELEYDEYDYCPNCGQAIDFSEE